MTRKFRANPSLSESVNIYFDLLSIDELLGNARVKLDGKVGHGPQSKVKESVKAVEEIGRAGFDGRARESIQQSSPQ